MRLHEASWRLQVRIGYRHVQTVYEKRNEKINLDKVASSKQIWSFVGGSMREIKQEMVASPKR